MSIETMPGPWAFLQSLGGAVGARSSVNHEREQEELTRARQLIMDAVMMRQQFADPSLTAGAGVQDAARRLGYSMPQRITSTERENELISSIIDRYSTPDESLASIPGITYGTTEVWKPGTRRGVTDEERRIARLPTRATSQEDANAFTRANAQGPGVARVAVAQQENELQPAIDSATDEVVLSYWADTGKLPTTAQAFAHGRNNARISRIGDAVTQDSYARAIRRIYEMDENRRIAAVRAAQGGSGSQDDILAQITAQMNGIQTERDELINSLPGTFASPAILEYDNPATTPERRTELMQNRIIASIAALDARKAELQTKWDEEHRRLRPNQPVRPAPVPTPTGAGLQTQPSSGTNTRPTGGTNVPSDDAKTRAHAAFTQEMQNNPRKYGTPGNINASQRAARQAFIIDNNKKFGITTP